MSCVVIGSGIAGLVSAIRVAQTGTKVTLLTKGLGGLPLSQGTIDVLGYERGPGADVDGAFDVRVADPLAAVDRVAKSQPGHPYAVIGSDAVGRGMEFVREAVGDELIVGNPVANVLLPTGVGALRPTCLAQPSMIGGDCTNLSEVVVVGLQRMKDFSAPLIAGNLRRAVTPGGKSLNVTDVTVDVPVKNHVIDTSGLTYATAFDEEAFRIRFVDNVRRKLPSGDTPVGVPAVLGLKNRSVWRDLSDRLERRVFEIVTAPPSVPGLRLNEALTAAAKAAGVRIVLGSKVIGGKASGAEQAAIEVEGDRVVAVSIAAAGGPRRFAADSFVLAAGGFESGGLAVDSRLGVRETIFDLPLAQMPDRPGDLINGNYWGPDQPLFAVGVQVDEQMRPVDGDGNVVYSNLRAAGGVLAGAFRWTEKSGEGIALGSAIAASQSLIEAGEGK